MARPRVEDLNEFMRSRPGFHAMMVTGGRKIQEAINARGGNPLAQQYARLHSRIKFFDDHEKKKTVSMLFAGTLCGLFAFAFAAFIGMIRVFDSTNFMPWCQYPSGYPYFPATVSDMVHDPKDPCGKVFFGFGFLGAAFLFNSWYPWELRNVFVGDDEGISFSGFTISWSMIRQIIPVPGMMLVCIVTTIPAGKADIMDWVCISVHLAGALAFFGVYQVCEWKCLFSQQTNKPLGQLEKRVRIFLLYAIIFWWWFFFGIQIFLGLPGIQNLGFKADVWMQAEDLRKHHEKLGLHDHEKCPRVTAVDLVGNEWLVADTASGIMFWFKVVSYIGEVVAGLCLLASLFAIWFFCEERHIDIEETMHDIGASDA